MRKVAWCLIAPLALGIGTAVRAGVEQTVHNFSSPAYSPNAFFWGTNRICVFCHTVHGGDQGSGPLWNHEVNPGQSYAMYDSPTLDMPQATAPHMASLICLSCHDGTIAVNSLNNVPGPAGAGTYGTPGGAGLDGAGRLTASSHAYVGTDLTDDHPVGITYDTGMDSNFYPKTGNSQLYPDRLLSDGMYVECTSCHDPHDNTYSDFLIEPNTDSDLCLRCHIQ